MTKYSVIVLLVVICININAQSELVGFGTLYPADESKYDKSFTEFLASLMVAIENRDKSFVYEIVDENIQLNEHAMNSSKENTRSGFMDKFNLDDSTNGFWQTASKLLYLGGKKDDYGCNCFTFPSIMHNNIFASIFGENYYYDVYDKNINYGSSVYESVPVYVKPDIYSDIIGFLKFQILKVNIEFEDNMFYQVFLKDNKAYYILKKDIYTCMYDYFMKFEKKTDGWKLVHFETIGL